MTRIDVARELAPDVRGVTRTQYEALVGMGFFDDQRVELLRGMIVEMQPVDGPHGLAVQWLNMRFARRLAEELHVRVQSSFAASDDSVPQPDLAVVRADWPYVDSTAPNPQRSMLVIEVANSSLRRDLRVKAGIYAEAEVDVYWVIDMVARQVVVHRKRVEGAYTDIERVDPPAVVHAAEVEVALQDLFTFAFPPHLT
ncbi:MAG TPA: Uma2 family endonuclease [Euzebya sp.]|nr:Uma2 family endonuclease [Euzebya sp.]